MLIFTFTFKGALFGVVLNELMPEAFICIILILVLFDSLRKTYQKYKQLRNKELMLL